MVFEFTMLHSSLFNKKKFHGIANLKNIQQHETCFACNT